MCVVSDFLDRVTAKAIGNETMLAPRLPSLFEPQAASIMPATFETNAIEEQRDTQAAPDVAGVAQRDPVVERSPSPLELWPNRAPLKQAQSRPDAVQHLVSRVATQPATETTRRSSDVVVEKMAQPTTTERARRQTTLREPLEPRGSRVSFERQAPPAIERPPETGALLPPAKPVFVSTKNLGDLPTRAAEAMHSRSIAAVGHRTEKSEPVVHVSIGRLEVRAAPNNGTVPPRRNEAPRPNSLDDYLRQRGKVTP
jgi:hypothetical protein